MIVATLNPRAVAGIPGRSGPESTSFDVDGVMVNFLTLRDLEAFIADLEAEARDLSRELYGEHPTDEIERLNVLYGLDPDEGQS